jgi:predicted RNA binding protein YcfA (HicA-like mRNA interferase family)
MTKKYKLFNKIKNNPKDVRFDLLRKMLIERGFELKRTSGSHFVFNRGEINFVLPAHNNKV